MIGSIQKNHFWFTLTCLFEVPSNSWKSWLRTTKRFMFGEIIQVMRRSVNKCTSKYSKCMKCESNDLQ